MATRKEAAEKKKELSSQISTLIRTLSLSTLAIAWLFLSGNDNAGKLAGKIGTSHLLFIAGACVVSILFDLVQYIAGYLSVAADYKKAKASSEPDKVIYSDSWRSRLRTFSFCIKIILAGVAAIYLVILLFLAVAS